nr:putative reverse transcriptase, RNA-dependent DNA polymerase [Tanacetum cinerariifolium]
CSRFQVTPKLSHLHAVKRIFRYLKCQPKLVLWYLRDSPFDLEVYSDSAYAGANLDRKSTTGGRQFLGRRLILWQCKKQTIVATSTTEVEDSYEKKLIRVLKIHTNDNVADLLTKAFDFWNTATSKIVNLVKQIHAIVDGKVVVISESSMRSDLLFNDEDEVNTSGSGEDNMEHQDYLTDFVPPTSHDSPLSGGHTPEHNLTDGANTEVIVEDKGSGEKGGGTADQVAFRDVEEPPRLTRSTSTLQPLPTIDPKDKGKGVLVKEELEKLEKVKRRDQGLAQINSDAEFAQRIYEEELAELDRAQKEKQKQEEATIAALTKELDEIQARMDVDHELAKKQLAAKRVEAIRNKSPTRTQIKNMMITYLKHMGNVDMEDLHVYKIIRANRNTSYHKSLSSMLRKFDRQDLVDLHRLVMKRFEDNTPEAYNLLLWGDLKKMYPLIKEMPEQMLNWKLEAEAESTMAFELLKFIKSQVEE